MIISYFNVQNYSVWVRPTINYCSLYVTHKNMYIFLLSIFRGRFVRGVCVCTDTYIHGYMGIKYIWIIIHTYIFYSHTYVLCISVSSCTFHCIVTFLFSLSDVVFIYCFSTTTFLPLSSSSWILLCCL